MFDLNAFMDVQVNEANDTKVIPVPPGEYVAVVGEIKPRNWQSKKDPSLSGVALDITWEIDSPQVKEQLGRDKVTVRQGIMLEMTESGGLDLGKGKNVGLGRLREAVGLNTPGQPFSFNMLPGRMAKVSVSHRIDGADIYAEVKQVAKMA